MSEENQQSDERYENDLHRAEAIFQRAYDDWELMVADDLSKICAGRRVVQTVRGRRKALSSVNPVESPKIEVQEREWPSVRRWCNLAVLCGAYAEAELRAFAELLGRRGVSRSQAVIELERHAEATLQRIYRLKWNRTGMCDLSAFKVWWKEVERGVRNDRLFEITDWISVFSGEWGSPAVLAQRASSSDGQEPATTEELDSNGLVIVAPKDRGAAVDAYLDEVFRATGKRIKYVDFWKAAGYTARTYFNRWRANRKNQTKGSDERFRRVLTMKPHIPKN